MAKKKTGVRTLVWSNKKQGLVPARGKKRKAMKKKARAGSRARGEFNRMRM